jgi:hypothetical protein
LGQDQQQIPQLRQCRPLAASIYAAKSNQQKSLVTKERKKENNSWSNEFQFWALILLSFIILIDNVPVILDGFHNKSNYRLYDGVGDALKEVGYFITVFIILLTMKFRKSKRDFIVVSIFALGIMLCINTIGLYKFIAISTLTLTLVTYVIFALLSRLKTQNKNDMERE